MRTVAAKVTSKGQVTIPQEVRSRLGLQTGDRVVFRIDDAATGDAAGLEREDGGATASLERIPDLIALAGSMPPPSGGDRRSWDQIREEAWREATRRRR